MCFLQGKPFDASKDVNHRGQGTVSEGTLTTIQSYPLLTSLAGRGIQHSGGPSTSAHRPCPPRSARLGGDFDIREAPRNPAKANPNDLFPVPAAVAPFATRPI